MEWKYFEQEIKKLSHKIDCKLDVIIGISRGGVVPARLLSTLLNVKEMYCLSVKKIKKERKVVTNISEGLTEKNILLVEDMLETGKSLDIAKKYLESKGAKVKTACLYTMPISIIKPTFYLRQIKEVEKFPWD